jgi:hypothetical protein
METISHPNQFFELSLKSAEKPAAAAALSQPQTQVAR